MLRRIKQFFVAIEHSTFKGTVSRDFRLPWFFHESVSPKSLSIPLGPFRIFSKNRGDIRSSGFATGIVEKSSIIKVLTI